MTHSSTPSNDNDKRFHNSAADYDKIPLGISSCLLGEAVRYNGGHCRSAYINNTLGNFFHFTAFCPEVSIGLAIPRPPIHLTKQENGDIQCVDVTTQTHDYTQALKQAALDQKSWMLDIRGYIFKKDSPSCGMERVKVYGTKGHSERNGIGIAAQTIMEQFPLLPTEEEGRLNDPILRENFIRRVYIYDQWLKLQSGDLSWKLLMRFHARIKYVLFSHNQNTARHIGRQLASSTKSDIHKFSKEYIYQVMSLLKTRANRKNHVNVLQHLQGYLRDAISAQDKRALTETLKEYRLGIVPLIVPIEILRYLFFRYPNEYVNDSFYLYPYPKELKLLNDI